MTIKNIVNKYKYKNCLSIDPSSNSLAWAVISTDNEVIDTGKINFTKGSDMAEKLSQINNNIPLLIKKYNVDCAVIEQSVYIQNFQSSRILSYIIGHTFGEIVRLNIKCEDITPLSWKPSIGYKNLSKREIEELKTSGVDLSTQVKLKNERKNRVRAIVSAAYGDDTPGLDDDDIVDALGIGLWYHLKYGARTI
jgi:Holliday junction resolvasome RuvABC endonuclease subunit